MRITQRELRQIIREELLRERRYLKRIDAVADVQRALNLAFKDDKVYVPLVIDKQWGPLTDAAWFKFVDKFYEPEADDPSKDDVKNHWETAGAALGYVTSGEELSNAANAAEFIESFLEEEPQGAVAATPIEGDTDGDGKLSNAELIAKHGSEQLKRTRIAGQHPWRLKSEPDSLPHSLTLDDADDWKYIIDYDGDDFDETDVETMTIKSKVLDGGYVVTDTVAGTESYFVLNNWIDTTPAELRGTLNDYLRNVVFLYEASDTIKKPRLMIWADDGEISGEQTTGFTIKTIQDFNRVFGAPAANESFTLRWAKLAGLHG